MPHPRVTDTDIRTTENGDLELTFSFDIVVLVGSEMVEFDLDPVGFFTWHYQRICDGVPA